MKKIIFFLFFFFSFSFAFWALEFQSNFQSANYNWYYWATFSNWANYTNNWLFLTWWSNNFTITIWNSLQHMSWTNLTWFTFSYVFSGDINQYFNSSWFYRLIQWWWYHTTGWSRKWVIFWLSKLVTNPRFEHHSLIPDPVSNISWSNVVVTHILRSTNYKGSWCLDEIYLNQNLIYCNNYVTYTYYNSLPFHWTDFLLVNKNHTWDGSTTNYNITNKNITILKPLNWEIYIKDLRIYSHSISSSELDNIINPCTWDCEISTIQFQSLCEDLDWCVCSFWWQTIDVQYDEICQWFDSTNISNSICDNPNWCYCSDLSIYIDQDEVCSDWNVPDIDNAFTCSDLDWCLCNWNPLLYNELCDFTYDFIPMIFDSQTCNNLWWCDCYWTTISNQSICYSNFENLWIPSTWDSQIMKSMLDKIPYYNELSELYSTLVYIPWFMDSVLISFSTIEPNFFKRKHCVNATAFTYYCEDIITLDWNLKIWSKDKSLSLTWLLTQWTVNNNILTTDSIIKREYKRNLFLWILFPLSFISVYIYSIFLLLDKLVLLFFWFYSLVKSAVKKYNEENTWWSNVINLIFILAPLLLWLTFFFTNFFHIFSSLISFFTFVLDFIYTLYFIILDKIYPYQLWTFQPDHFFNIVMPIVYLLWLLFIQRSRATKIIKI